MFFSWAIVKLQMIFISVRDKSDDKSLNRSRKLFFYFIYKYSLYNIIVNEERFRLL